MPFLIVTTKRLIVTGGLPFFIKYVQNYSICRFRTMIRISLPHDLRRFHTLFMILPGSFDTRVEEIILEVFRRFIKFSQISINRIVYEDGQVITVKQANKILEFMYMFAEIALDIVEE
jgi:hypothetical protein